MVVSGLPEVAWAVTERLDNSDLSFPSTPDMLQLFSAVVLVPWRVLL